MSKRKLTRRQQWRIDKIQQERLQRAERKVGSADADGQEDGDAQSGQVIAHYGQQVVVEDAAHQQTRCHFRATLEQLVVGDRVLFHPPTQGDVGVVSALAERSSVLKRPDPYGNLKPVAANVDRMLIVFAPVPTPSSQLLDRYLVAAELSGIEPLLVLNKSDLIDDSNRETLLALVDLYQSLNYQVLQASATDAHGLDALRAALVSKTSIFVGQSGVGKSSLINALMPEAALSIGDISSNSGLGQHTTVTAQLLRFPGGGDLIDSPGVREFGLWHIDEGALLRGYVDLAELAGHCKFRNCSHLHEPSCALRLAAEAGDISTERLENYYRIRETLDDEARSRY